MIYSKICTCATYANQAWWPGWVGGTILFDSRKYTTDVHLTTAPKYDILLHNTHLVPHDYTHTKYSNTSQRHAHSSAWTFPCSMSKEMPLSWEVCQSPAKHTQTTCSIEPNIYLYVIILHIYVVHKKGSKKYCLYERHLPQCTKIWKL